MRILNASHRFRVSEESRQDSAGDWDIELLVHIAVNLMNAPNIAGNGETPVGKVEMPTLPERRVRVGFILTAIHAGGLESFTLDLARRLPKENFEALVFNLTSEQTSEDRFAQSGIRVFSFRAFNRPRLGALSRNFWAMVRLARVLHEERVDIVHTCDFFPAVMGRVASLLAGVPVRLHTLHSDYDWFPCWAHLVNRALARCTDAITAVSDAVMASSLRLDGIHPDKYRMIHNGVDADVFAPDPSARNRMREWLGIPRDARVVLSVGAYSRRKGHRITMDAAIPLLREDPRLHLVILGQQLHRDDDTQHLLDMARTAGVFSQVHMPGPREEIATYLAGCDVYCMSSYVEGLSLAALEAQMCGCLCVFSDLPSFREIVRDSDDGLLFPVGDAPALRTCLEHLLHLDPIVASAKRELVRTRAVERFSLENMVARYVEIYRQALAQS